MVLTNVLIWSTFVLVPHRDEETLLGQVRSRGGVDKLFMEVWVQALPLDRGRVLGSLCHRMQNTEIEHDDEVLDRPDLGTWILTLGQKDW